MVKPKTEEEIELLRENAILVSKTLAEVGRHIEPGVTTKALNAIAEEFIRDHGAIPSFLGYEGFPAALCMSVNDVVVHGFPSDKPLQEGDVVSVDCGTLYKGYQGDSAYTFPVGEVDAETRKLLDATKASLYKGIEAAVAGNRTGDIGYAVQSYVEALGFSVVRELEGHGLGREMHEQPGVPNYGRRGKDNYDIYVVGKLLKFLVEKQCKDACEHEDCPECYALCGDCPKDLIKDFLIRNNIK